MSNPDNQTPQTKTVIDKYFFRASAADFKKIPGNPISYWISASFREAFRMPPLGSQFQTRLGLSTANNDLFLRCWQEASFCKISLRSSDRIDAKNGGRRWFPYEKGGPFRKWYGNHDLIVNWQNDGEAIRSFGASEGRIRSHNYNLDYIFKEGVTWSDVTSGANAFRYMPNGFLFDGRGSSGFFDDHRFFGEIFGFLNSKVASHAISMINPTIVVNVGEVARLPFPGLQQEERVVLDSCVMRLTEIHKNDWDSYESSWGFSDPHLLHPEHYQLVLKAAYHDLYSQWRELLFEAKHLEEKNNRLFIEAYGLQDELTPDVPLKEITLTCNPHYRYGGNKTDEELEALLLADTMREFLSYAVGCMFGRYSRDKAGLVLANQGETLDDFLAQVPEPSFRPDEDNVIPMLDGEWFADDVTERFRAFLHITFGDEHYAENLAFVENGLNIKGKRNYSIRDFFVKEFYAYHVKLYKKRPIYWLFASPKGTFQALVYLHRYRPDTVSVVLQYLRDFRTKLQAHQQQLETRAVDPDVAQGEKTRLNKALDTLKKQILELDDYERDTLYPLATQRIEIDLDDGVKANYPKFGAALKPIPGLAAKDD